MSANLDNLTPSPQEVSQPPSSDISRVVDLIATQSHEGGAHKDWIEENILSIREAVKDGKHSTIYYPGSGVDILRPLLAYDADRLISVDMVFNGIAQRQLTEIGIPVSVEGNGDRVTAKATIDGAEREVTEIKGDARLVSFKDEGLDNVDVLHIYLPAGAIDAGLNPTTYQMVNEGGFFVFGEKDEFSYEPSYPLLAIAGLEEKKITQRYPYSVTTSHKRVDVTKKDGCIYHKKKEVDPEVIAEFNRAKMTWFWADRDFEETNQGHFEDLNLVSKDGEVQVQEGIESSYQEFVKKAQGHAARFAELGVDQSLIDAFTTELLHKFQLNTYNLQQQCITMLNSYDEIIPKHNAGEMTESDVHEEMGIEIRNNELGESECHSDKFPLVPYLLYSANFEQVYAVADQLSRARFSFQTSEEKES